MTVIGRFEVIPVREGSMSSAIASALRTLDRFPVSYRTTATDTVIEADSIAQLFAAVQAAHEAIPEQRVITSLEVDEDRRRPQRMSERVASVERALGHPPERSRQPAQQQPVQQSQSVSPPATQPGPTQMESLQHGATSQHPQQPSPR